MVEAASANEPVCPAIENLQDTVPVEEDVEENARIDSEFQAMEKAISSLANPAKVFWRLII
jgi:hypothetical protein